LKYKRERFSKFYIFFDESGAMMNNRKYKEFDNVFSEYVNQNRKLFTDIYLVSAD
jgi:CTP:phosphocholine cytidylyltransferase-like protein